MVVTVPIFTTGPNANTQGKQVGLKIQPASDSSGAYVPVVALDSEASISIGDVSIVGELPSGTNTIGTVNQGVGGISAWKVDPSGVTAPVAVVSIPSLPPGDNQIGTVTANAGTNLNTSALALEDGGNLAAIADTVSDGRVRVDPSGVTSPISAASLPLPTNAAQETGGNLATIAGTVATGKVKVDPSGVTSPVSLTSLPTLASGSNIVGKVGIDQTTPGTTNRVSIGTDGTVTANAGTNLNTSALALESGGNLATIAGTVSAGKVSTNATQSGAWAVTANAGTNLNTSALALETGGNLATIAGTVATGKVKVDPSGVTSPVSLTSLPALVAGSANIGSVNQGTSPWIVQSPDTTSTGNTINAATLNAAYTVSLANGEAAMGFTISGLTASGATLTLEGSAADGTTFTAINEIQNSGTIGPTITADGNYYINSGGRTKVRLRVSVIGTGTITVASLASAASSRVTVQASLPPGANAIGSVYSAPTSSSTFAIAPGSSSALESSHVLKASAGNLYSLNVTTTTASGYLMTFNAISAPADGAVTPVECIPVSANSVVSISFSGAPPDFYSTGIIAVFSTTGPFTKTSSATAFFKWRVQ